jgi:hypothetical protein
VGGERVRAEKLAEKLVKDGFKAVVMNDPDLFEGEDFIRVGKFDVHPAGECVYVYGFADGSCRELSFENFESLKDEIRGEK